MSGRNHTPSPSRRVPVQIRTGAVIIAIATLMTSAFVAAYTVALGRPAPRHIPIAVVGPADATASSIAALSSTQQHDLAPRAYQTRQAAVDAVDVGTVSAVIDGTATPTELLVSTASDASTARALEQIVPNVEPARLRVTDLHPLPASDPQGLATFYVVIAATILGFVTMFQLRANLNQVTLRQWLAVVAVLSMLGGATLSLVAGPVLDALNPPFLQIWALLALQIAIAALFNSTMLVLIGRWAIIPTWTLFIVFGNTSSGGAVAAPLLPEPFASLNHALPTGATVSAIHAATYFPGHQHILPVLVLIVWLILTFTALLAFARILNRSPVSNTE